ncbi:DUF2920 family protein [Aquibacillus kalidii]|uniref:DUF2920 family protein n=1 Tax=Aquibacillus kalidii TaxID=2762597 RepID=UPI0016447D93|nr:DUF2920 family protein [Aquibacillus kalidii]
MAEQHSLHIPAHQNIYNGSCNRELRIEFSIPENGVNERTGLVIFVPGFGGDIDSNVYTKMRRQFADKYNLVTIQCDYFGSCYMQSTNKFSYKDPDLLNSILTVEELEKIKINSSALSQIISNKNTVLPLTADLDETIEHFNDMGYMQAIDLICAIETIKIILKDNNLSFNSKRIIGYGHSHGAYLLHLSNRLAPNLFSFIIDNSAWTEPGYLSGNRHLYNKLGKATLAIEFNYLAKDIIKHKNDLNLSTLYKNFNMRTQVLAFQGDEDNLINHNEKKKIIASLSNSDYILVKKEDIDNIKYKSNNHGLNADFFELFQYAINFERSTRKSLERESKYEIRLKNTFITVDYSHGLPIFNFDFR